MTLQGRQLRKGTYAHYALTDIYGVVIDPELNPMRPALSSTSQNGFTDRSETTLSFTDGTRTLTITPVDDAFYFWAGGTKYKKTAADSIQIDDTEGLHYIYYDTDGKLADDNTFDLNTIIYIGAYVAVVYWDATNNTAIYVGDERHLRMDAEIHSYLHEVFNTQWISGLSLGNMSVDAVGSSNSSAQLSVENGAIRDEDIKISIVDDSPQNLSTVAYIPFYYRSGANGDWRKISATGYCVTTTGTGRAAYNDYTGATWQLSEVPTASFVLMHIFATTNISEPIIYIVGQDAYLTKAAAEEAALTEINELLLGSLNDLSPEFRPIATIIVQTSSGYSNSVKSRIVSTADGSDYVDWRKSDVGSGGIATETSDITALPVGINLVINPLFQVWQRVTDRTAVQTGTNYIADRWFVQDTKGTVESYYDEGECALNLNPVANYSSGGSEYFRMQYAGIEAQDLAVLDEDTVTLTMVFKADDTTPMSIKFRLTDSVGTAHYLHKTIVPITPGTYETFKITLDISAFTFAKDNTEGLNWYIHCAETRAGAIGGTDDVWSTTNYVSSTEITRASGSSVYFRSFKLEPGSNSTALQKRKYLEELRDCKRYYAFGSGNTYSQFRGDVTSGYNYEGVVFFEVEMRVSPTIVLTNVSVRGFPATTGTVNGSIKGFREIRESDSTVFSGFFFSTWTASADFI